MDRTVDLMPAEPARPLLAPEVSAAIDAAVDAYAEDAFRFLERLVAADSTVGHEQAALEVLASELHGLGFEIERLPIPENVADLPGAGIPRFPYAGRYDLVGRRRGDPALPSLLLNGHIDVVPADEPGLWTIAAIPAGAAGRLAVRPWRRGHEVWLRDGRPGAAGGA